VNEVMNKAVNQAVNKAVRDNAAGNYRPYARRGDEVLYQHAVVSC